MNSKNRSQTNDAQKTEITETTGTTEAPQPPKEKPKKKKLNNFLYDFIKITGILPALLLFRPKFINVGGGKAQKIKGGALVVSNHYSYLDPIAIHLVFWRRRLRILATKDLFERGKGMNFLFRQMHCIMVDKQSMNAESLYEATDALTDGQVVVVFPEGQVNTGDKTKLMPFKKGAVMMAHRGNAPIIPVYQVPRKSLWQRQVILIGEPIYIRDVLGENPPYKELRKMSVYLHDKEQELLDYYNAHYAKKSEAEPEKTQTETDTEEFRQPTDTENKPE